MISVIAKSHILPNFKKGEKQKQLTLEYRHVRTNRVRRVLTNMKAKKINVIIFHCMNVTCFAPTPPLTPHNSSQQNISKKLMNTERTKKTIRKKPAPKISTRSKTKGLQKSI